ncbi:hypothetical protein V8G54_005520 [Vigna mungo]|uniref:Uncharacterized protein n=1 Tax=Vigna mungo TaxID=3915 RepID=A0AAQ3S6H6_VIGMU
MDNRSLDLILNGGTQMDASQKSWQGQNPKSDSSNQGQNPKSNSSSSCSSSSESPPVNNGTMVYMDESEFSWSVGTHVTVKESQAIAGFGPQAATMITAYKHAGHFKCTPRWNSTTFQVVFLCQKEESDVVAMVIVAQW